eukprot:359555-Chlamydomonas_euryale.AAC.13
MMPGKEQNRHRARRQERSARQRLERRHDPHKCGVHAGLSRGRCCQQQRAGLARAALKAQPGGGRFACRTCSAAFLFAGEIL